MLLRFILFSFLLSVSSCSTGQSIKQTLNYIINQSLLNKPSNESAPLNQLSLFSSFLHLATPPFLASPSARLHNTRQNKTKQNKTKQTHKQTNRAGDPRSRDSEEDRFVCLLLCWLGSLGRKVCLLLAGFIGCLEGKGWFGSFSADLIGKDGWSGR